MNSETANRLLDINHEFYNKFGDSFSLTRHRIQPGVQRVLDSFKGDEDILDLGCGNGWFARALSNRNHFGSYLGLDFSLPMLQEAESLPEDFPARFYKMDITQLSITNAEISSAGAWSLVTAFAVLHHLPSSDIRMKIFKTIHSMLKPDGLFIHSNWQFLNSPKLKSRILGWERVGLSPIDVDPNDYLLDWRSGGNGIRYVHHFSETELSELAAKSNFKVVDVFYSDGVSEDLGLYQIWKKL